MNISDDSIEILLGEAGLNQSECQAYQAGLGATQTSAELLRKTNMPRPTLMAALQSLRNYGLCEAHRRDGRSLAYTMLPLTNIKAHLGTQIRSIDRLIERLDAFNSGRASDITVQTNQGQEALKNYLELALRCKNRRWQIIAPKENALSNLPKEYLDYFKRTRTERQIESETLWEFASSSQQLALRDVLMRKPRYVPENLGKDIPTLMLAFDDNLLIADGITNPTVVLLTASSVTATFSMLFDMAWRYARN